VTQSVGNYIFKIEVDRSLHVIVWLRGGRSRVGRMTLRQGQ
jgi:hypothetical protein